ncbi:MAG: polysaccharide pyruvyl transferase family protein [Candidatus Marinimicrobia bacterium]|nr:polysaccharide pyruvyl transferase family protein [Candidatus Neomarinimicrobiota bacterium]
MILRSINPNINFVDYPIVRKKILRHEIRHLNKIFDALVVGGGGLLYNRKEYAAKWYFNVSSKDYQRLKIPKCFWGIGINQEFSNQEKWIINNDVVKAIDKFSESTNAIGVRDRLTIDFFRKNISSSARLVPCPSMFILKDVVGNPEKKGIALNLTTRSVDIEKLMKALNPVINYLRRKSYEIIFVPHVLREDKKIFPYLMDANVKIFVPSSPENLMEFYKNQQFLIGMRGHSLIYCTGANIPMIALSYNRKCDGHMEMLGLEDYLVKHENIYNTEMIIEKIKLLLNKYTEIKSALLKKFEFFYKLNLEFAHDFLNNINISDGQ